MSDTGEGLVRQAHALCIAEPPDFDSALHLLKRAAELDCAEALYALGDWHHIGRAVEQDDELAFSYALRAAQLGHGPAMQDLAFHYEEGLGCEESIDEALHWYEKAADHGQPEAAHHVACILEDQRQCYDPTIVEWYRRSADAGYAAAQFSMGYFYEWGYVVELDTKVAEEWYRLAAAQGYEDAVEALRELSDNESSDA